MSRRLVLVSAALLVLAAGNAAARTNWTFADSLDEAAVEAFVALNSGQGNLWLRQWTSIEAERDDSVGGLAGRMMSVSEYLIQDNTRLDEAARIYTLDLAYQVLKGVRITVKRGPKLLKYGQRDLTWSRATPVEGRVVDLDGTRSLAVIPDLRAGDRVTIELEHRLVGIFGLPPHQLGMDGRPCFQSGLEIRVPASYQLESGLMGTPEQRAHLSVTRNSDGHWSRAAWVVQANPDGVLTRCGERYPSVRVTPYLARMGPWAGSDVSVGADWEAIGRAALARVEGAFAADEALAAESAQLVAGASTASEKIDRLYRHVQNTCHYLGLYEGLGGWIPVPAVRVRELGSGDCKGLAALLIARLRSVGIDAHPVFVRTSDVGPLDLAAPNLLQFNHFIAWADDGEGGVFLDGTTDYFPAGRVPAADNGSPVFRLGPGAPRLVRLPDAACPTGQSRVSITGDLQMSATAGPGLELNLEYTATENLGTWWRAGLARLSRREQEEMVLEFLLPREPHMSGGPVEILGMDDWSGPFVLRAKAATTTPLPSAPGRVFLPGALTSVTMPVPGIPACGDSLDLREFPAREFQWRLRLPAGLSFDGLAAAGGDESGLAWEERVEQQGQELVLSRSIRFTRQWVNRKEAEALARQVEKVRAGRSGYFELRY